MSGSTAALQTALHQALGEPALWVGAWRGPGVIRAVYAFPSLRIATLAHWRDETEFCWQGSDVVAFEAAKFARLLLKSHDRTLTLCAQHPSDDPYALMTACANIAQGLWTEEAQRWATRDAHAVPPGAYAMPPAERFAAVNGWLTDVRRTADASFT